VTSDSGRQDSRRTYFSTSTLRAVNCQAASSKAASWKVMLNAAVSPAAKKMQSSRNQVLTRFEPPTPGRDPEVTPNESGSPTSL